jgi:hypothetical protein
VGPDQHERLIDDSRGAQNQGSALAACSTGFFFFFFFFFFFYCESTQRWLPQRETGRVPSTTQRF